MPVLPLGRFSIIRDGTSEDADLSIRSRHPGAYGFQPHGRDKDWRINVNLLNLGRANVIATRSSAFAISNTNDGIVRVFVPVSRSADVRTRDRRKKLRAGGAIIVPAGGFACDFEDGFTSLIATFPQAAVAEALTCFGGVLPSSNWVGATFDDEAWLDPIKRQLQWLVRAIDLEPELIVQEQRFRRAHEELLLLHLAQALASADKTGDEHRASSIYLDRGLAFIHAHLFDDIGPMVIARAAGCSLRNLQVLFRREFNRTITESVRDLRLQAARRRLIHGRREESITTVAIECGFSHLSDFARHYRQLYGERPSQTLAAARVGGL